MSSRSTPKNTFGWQRAEVLGALVNSVFLLALCFTIIVEAIQRFVELEEINDPMLVLIVGGIGLLVNGLGLCLFSTHGKILQRNLKIILIYVFSDKTLTHFLQPNCRNNKKITANKKEAYCCCWNKIKALE